MLSPRVHPFMEMALFNMASQRSKVQLAPPSGNMVVIFKIAVITPKSGIFKSTHCRDFQHKTISGTFRTVEQKATIFLPT